MYEAALRYSLHVHQPFVFLTPFYSNKLGAGIMEAGTGSVMLSPVGRNGSHEDVEINRGKIFQGT